MYKNSTMLPTLIIQQKIFVIRGEQVMLDYDLAEMYGMETRTLKQAVRRNMNRFPSDFMSDFMFELTKEEYASLRSQSVTLKKGRGQHSKYLPYAFTEQGVAMLSSILNSDIAIEVNIAIMRTFVAVRRLVTSPALPDTSPAERTGARCAGAEGIYGRSLYRPKRYQRGHPHAIGTYQPSLGRVASCQTTQRETSQPHRIQILLNTHR